MRQPHLIKTPLVVMAVCTFALLPGCPNQRLDSETTDSGPNFPQDGGESLGPDAGTDRACSIDLAYEGCTMLCDGGACNPASTEFYVAWNCFIQDETNFSCSTDAQCTVVPAHWFECGGDESALFNKSGLPLNLSAADRARAFVSRYMAQECSDFRQAFAPSRNDPDGAEAIGARCLITDGTSTGTCVNSAYDTCGGCGSNCDGGI